MATSVLRMMEGTSKLITQRATHLNIAPKMEVKGMTGITHLSHGESMSLNLMKEGEADFAIGDLMDAYNVGEKIHDALDSLGGGISAGIKISALLEGNLHEMIQPVEMENKLQLEIPKDSVSLEINTMSLRAAEKDNIDNVLEDIPAGEITVEKMKEIIEENSVVMSEELSVKSATSASSIEEVLNNLPETLKEIKAEIEEEQELQKILEETKEEILEKLPISEELEKVLLSGESSSAPSLSEILETTIVLPESSTTESPSEVLAN